jgi:uncharacterized C2H2 Zn-finger protein
MGRSSYLNVDGARTQEAYFARIRAAVNAFRTGKSTVQCPREGCGEIIEASRYGQMLTVRCPACGLIFRGNEERLMAYYE